MKTFKFFLTILGIFVVVPALGVMVIWHGRCDEKVVLESPSPDQKFTAQMTLKDCGPSQPVATIVRLFDVATRRSSETMLLIEGPSEVRPTWSDPLTLAVAVPKDAKVVYRRHAWESINLKYGERDGAN